MNDAAKDERPKIGLALLALLLLEFAFHGYGGLIFLVPALLWASFRELPTRRCLLYSTLWGMCFAGTFYLWVLSYGWLAWIGIVLVRGLPWVLFLFPSVLWEQFADRTPLKDVFSAAAGYFLVTGALLLGPTGNDWETPIGALCQWPWFLASLPWIGLTGSAFLIGLVSVSMILKNRSCFILGTATAVLWALLNTWMFSATLHEPTLFESPIAVVQTGWSQEKKWDESSRKEAIERLFELTETAAEQGAKLIVWPETAWPYHGMRRRPSDTRAVGRLARRLEVDILASSIESKEEDWFNSVSQVLSTGRFHLEYRKTRLAPFAEYLPLPKNWEDNFRTRQPFQQIGRFVPGDESVPFDHGERRFGVLICFESMVPGPTKSLSTQVDYFVVVTNDEPLLWPEPKEAHFRSAILRAAEFRKPFVQASNTGVSGFVDARGTVLMRSGHRENGPLTLVYDSLKK